MSLNRSRPASRLSFVAILLACVPLARCESVAKDAERGQVLRWSFDGNTPTGMAPYHCDLTVENGILVVRADGAYSSPTLGTLITAADPYELRRLTIRARTDGPSPRNDLLVYLNSRAMGVGLSDVFEVHSVDLHNASGWRDDDQNTLAIRWSHCTPSRKDRILIDWMTVELGPSVAPVAPRDDLRPAPPTPGFETRPDWREPHPFLADRIWPRDIDELKMKAAKLIKMDDDDIPRLIPTRSDIATQCPKCREKTQFVFGWDVENPSRFRCAQCELTFPNETYPENGSEKVTNLRGEEVTYQFHEAEDGQRFYLSGTAAMNRHRFFVDHAERIGRIYHAEKDPALARKVALILDRYAQVTPSYCVVGTAIARRPRRPFSEVTPPYPVFAGRFSTWWFTEVPFELLVAYDLTYNDGAYDELSRKRGLDVRARIEKDLFMNTATEVLTRYPFSLGNMTPIMATRFVALGRTVGCPDMVHMGAWLASGLGMSQYFHDGFWKEGTVSYHTQTTGRLHETFIHLAGYTDPPGYVDAAFGLKLTNVDLDADFPFQKLCRSAHQALTMPDGRFASIHDTHFGPAKAGPADVENGPRILPGFGHAVLGRGSAADQMDVHLHFDDATTSHAHGDVLNLILFAKGREMIPDIGYGRGVLRYWTTSSLSHNVVLVDERGPGFGDGPEGSLRRLALSLPEVQIVEADGHRAFAGNLSLYSRALVLVGLSKTDAYVVDLFRVRGGSLHELLLHGDADRDMKATESPGFQPRSGTYYGPDYPYSHVSLPGRVPYGGLMDDVRTQVTSDTWWTEWRYVDAPDTGLRVTSLGSLNAEILVGQGPSIRRSKHQGIERAREEDTYKMPMLVSRRRRHTAAPHESAFASVLEPFSGAPGIEWVRPLVSPDANALDVGMAIRSTRGLDRIVSSRDARPLTWSGPGGGLAVTGAFALARTTDAGDRELMLVGGTNLATGGIRIRTGGDVSAAVTSTRRGRMGEPGALVLECDLPEGDVLAGRWLVVTHPDETVHGYEVRRVTREDALSVVHTVRDPGFEIDDDGNTRWLYYPQRTLRGENIARLSATAWVSVRGTRARVTCTVETRVGFGTEIAEVKGIPQARRDPDDPGSVTLPPGTWEAVLDAEE